MKKTRKYYVCDICGAESPAQIVVCSYNLTDTYSTHPIGWERGYNPDMDVCPKCAEKLKKGGKEG